MLSYWIRKGLGAPRSGRSSAKIRFQVVLFKPKQQARPGLPFRTYVSFNEDTNMNIIHGLNLVKQLLSQVVKVAGIRDIPKDIKIALLVMFSTASIMLSAAIFTAYMAQIWVDIILKLIEVINRLG
jgi:hypothetical protein